MTDAVPLNLKTSKLQFCEGVYIFQCPWCEGCVIVEPQNIACGIFRHAVYKENCLPINPHMPKDHCDQLLTDNRVYGCTKPFRIVSNEYAIECDYI